MIADEGYHKYQPVLGTKIERAKVHARVRDGMYKFQLKKNKIMNKNVTIIFYLMALSLFLQQNENKKQRTIKKI